MDQSMADTPKLQAAQQQPARPNFATVRVMTYECPQCSEKVTVTDMGLREACRGGAIVRIRCRGCEFEAEVGRNLILSPNEAARDMRFRQTFQRMAPLRGPGEF